MEYELIVQELREYCRAGGKQFGLPAPGCGRDGVRLLQLSKESGVVVVASTGFHRRIYYLRAVGFGVLIPRNRSFFY